MRYKIEMAGVCIFSRVGGIQTINVGQQNQNISPSHRGNLRGKTIVVAKADFVGCYGVILVNDRNNAQLKQRPHGRARIQVAAPVFTVFERHKHLRGLDPVGGQNLLVGARQTDLPHRSCSLRALQRQCPATQFQHPTPQRDRAGRDDKHLFPLLFQHRDVCR